MGVWVLGSSVGSYLAGRAGGLYETLALPTLFATVAGITIAGGVALALAIRPIRRLMGGVH
jgi:POT family proton-dependent oligopeptide transporter